MVEDAGARADGGDAEAPAEAPRLKHARSSRRRLPNRRMAAYSARWAHAEVFDKLSESSSTAPVTIELDYYKCKMKLREVVEEALGISVGNAALVYILTSVICVHALVRALGKCGAVRFRNGRFISPVVLDEYLERKSVDAVLRQEREKETEETDPFL